MPPQEPSCSRILPPSARDFPIICPGASGTISERDSRFESASLQRGVYCKPDYSQVYGAVLGSDRIGPRLWPTARSQNSEGSRQLGGWRKPSLRAKRRLSPLTVP